MSSFLFIHSYKIYFYNLIKIRCLNYICYGFSKIFFEKKSVGPPSLEQDTVMAVFDRKIYDIFNAFVCVIDVHWTKYDMS